MSYFSLADLFLVGLALDILGAILLAKGLLLTPREQAKLNSWDGISHGLPEDRLRNRVDGQFGVCYLMGGFVLQAAGYAAQIDGVHSETGPCRMLVALALAGALAGVGWLIWALCRDRQIEGLRRKVEKERPAAAQEIEDAKRDD